MPRTTTMTVPVPEDVVSRLEALARSSGRTKTYLASRAIEEYVSAQESQVRAIAEAVAEANAGDTVFLDHGEVEAQLAERAGAEAPRVVR